MAETGLAPFELWRIGRLRRTMSTIVPNGPIVLNQLLNSAANFLITVALVRILGFSEFGIFTIYFLIAQSIVSVIVALYVQPAVSIAASSDGEESSGLLAAAAALYIGTVVTLALLVAAGALIWPDAALVSFATLLVVMAAIEMARRLMLFLQAVALTWLLDLLRFGAVAIAITFDASRSASAISAMEWLAAGYALGLTVLLLPAARPRGGLSLARFGENARRLLKSGKWLSISSVLTLINDNIFIVAGSVVAGAEAVGIVRSCQSIVGLVHPLLFALEHVLPRRIGQLSLTLGWSAALDSYSRLASLAVAAFAVLLAGLGLLAGQLLTLTIGPGADVHAWVLQAICLSYLPFLAYVMATFPLRAVERTRPVAVSLATSAAVAALIAVPLVQYFGIAGIVAGFLVARLVTASVVLAGYERVRREVAAR